MIKEKSKRNVSFIKDCYGCGVCVISCPKKIIDIRLNKNGFLEPVIENQLLCVECEACLQNCAYNHVSVATENVPLMSYAAWSNSEFIRYNSSSGGVCYEICKYLVSKGYKICGAKYDSKINNVKHVLCSTIEELNQISGSKYLQSNTVDCFEQINKFQKYVVIGTPCQIDSVRRFIKSKRIEDNFILIDFFCHGVPSYNLWKKFSAAQKENIGGFISVTWRNKTDGWHKSYRLDIKAELGEYHHTGLKFDDFFDLYFSNSALSPACFDKCKYKLVSSSADIRLGDMWGEKFTNNREGVNSVICFTDKGNEIFQKIDCETIHFPVGDVISGQMKSSPLRDGFYLKLNPLINENSENWHEIVTISRKMQLKKRIIEKLRSCLNFSKIFC